MTNTTNTNLGKTTQNNPQDRTSSVKPQQNQANKQQTGTGQNDKNFTSDKM